MKNKYGEGARDDTDSEEEDPLNPHASVKQRMSKKLGGKLSNVESGFTIFKAFVGVGLLSTPSFAYASGWAINPILMAASLVLTLYCVKLLVECAEYYRVDSLPAIAFEAYGTWAKVLTDILIVCSQMGFCTSYIFFIAS